MNGKDNKSEMMNIYTFVVYLSASDDYQIRYLEIIDDLSIILRYDQHLYVNNKANKKWKERVSNTNKVLNNIFEDVISFISLIIRMSNLK